jgi:hypothetical protein
VKITDAYNFSFKNENNALVKELPWKLQITNTE